MFAPSLSRHSVAILALALFLCTDSLKVAVSHAQSPPAGDLATLLSHEILEPDQPFQEVQRFCETRVRTLEPYSSWSAWQRDSEQLRQEVLDRVVFVGQAREWRDAACAVEYLDTIEGGPGYKIKKLRYEALPGLWIPALLYEPEVLSGRVPVVLNVNGHDSNGKAAPYKQMRCINLAKRGMLALNVEWLGMGQLKSEGFLHYRLNQLDLCGTSGVGVFYLAMQRGLDLLLDHPNADVERTAMAGLSGGGWQTIFFSSLDRRVQLSDPVAGYSSFKTRARFLSDLGDSEQTPNDLAMIADYTHLTAMRAPRPTLLTFNIKDDCCFASDHALPPLLDAARPLYELAGVPTRLTSHINHDPGTHNFERDNREAFYKFVGEQFFPGDESYKWEEIPSEGEVKTAEQLAVALPEKPLDLHMLAVAAARDLPRRSSEQPFDRESLRRLVRDVQAGVGAATAERVGEESSGDLQAVYWRLKFGDTWTIPVVELKTGGSKTGQLDKTAIVVADAGRASLESPIRTLLASGHRVLAVDPFYLGESSFAKHRDFLFALLVQSVGARPVGVQAAQLGSVAAWAKSEFKSPHLSLHAAGPRIGLSALVSVASGLATDVEVLELQDSLSSLKQIIENDWRVDTHPELFCFGLLERCDVEDLMKMAAPCRVLHQSLGAAASAKN